MTSNTIIMMVAVPRSGWIKTRPIGIPAMIRSLKTSFHAKPSSAPTIAIGRHGHEVEEGTSQLIWLCEMT